MNDLLKRTESSSEPSEESLIAIVGSGFSGIGMAIRLKQAGIHDFVILERASSVGGVWRDNSYPGCACDVESHLYSFSFAPNPHWSRQFSRQAEICAYLRDCAKRFGLMPHMRFGQDLCEARWDEATKSWAIATHHARFKAKIFINATGAFSQPLIPDIPGLDRFQGSAFHSAGWNHDFDLSHKRIAVVGTGASAIQFIPEVQKLAAHLTLYQRTPPWVMPRDDHPITRDQQASFVRYPILQKAKRLAIYLKRELLGFTFRHPQLMAIARYLATQHLQREVKDPELRKRLTPNYEIGCKRILIANDYYPALVQANVELVTSAIEALTEEGIRSADGIVRSFDAIIWGTGFRVTDFSIAKQILGREGKRLSDRWQGSPSSYRGTAIPDFPNLFFLLGPNTGLGHSSIVLMIETQIELIRDAVLAMQRAQIASLEVKPEREAAFRVEMDQQSSKTVWILGACKSWYLDSKGRNSTLWPRSVGAFRRRILPFQIRDFKSEK